MQVWIVATDATDTQICSDDEHTRAARFRSPEVAARWLGGRAAIRTILAGCAGVDPAAVRFGRTELGKMWLDGHPEVEFSHAHSGGWVCIAISDRPVGLDIEAPRHLLRPERLARRLGVPFDGTDDVLQHWTRAEALVKATGEGVRSPFRGIEARLGADGWCVRDVRGLPVICAVAAYGEIGDVLLM